MKQLKNGLNAIYYYDLPSMVDEGEPISSIIQQAHDIVEARKRNAEPLQKAKENTLVGLEELQSSLETLKEKIGDYCEDNTKVNKIIREADIILENIPLFRTSAEVLCSRLSEGKIRIVSIGEKNQGKSLFTQIFTGLPSDSKILKVKAHDDTNDCTGAVNTFYHKDGQTLPLIQVEFLTVKEVVDNIESAIKLIRAEINDENWTLKGVDSISNQNELRSFLKDTNHQAVIASLVINPEVKSSLEQYFISSDNDLSFISLLGKNQITVSENDVDEYNDMQHPSKHYLAVKKINVTLDLLREGLFQYFEVADTKGLSAEAGAVANQKLIFDVINESDAVLSIARTGGQQNWKIYTQALGDHYRNNSVFKEKHFAIINVEERYGMVSADSGAKFIDDQKLSDYCYIGRLWEDSVTDSKDSIPEGAGHCVPKAFVDNLIIHMLGKIANHITEIDNERIRVCQQSGNKISGALSKLKELLGDIKYIPFNEDKLVKEKVLGFSDSALKYIEEQKSEIRKKKVVIASEDESDNVLYYRHVTDKSNENRFASVYEVLTGEQYPGGKLPQIDDDDEGDKEIEKAAAYLFQLVKGNNRIPNNRFHAGNYVNALVGAIRLVILNPVFEKGKQHPIACKMKEELFDKLWEIYHLNGISGKQSKWDSAYIDEGIREMKDLNNVYNKGVFSPFIKSEELMTPYSFMKEYFTQLFRRSSEEEFIEEHQEQEFEDDLCLKTIEKEFAKLSLRNKIVDSIKNFPDYMESFCKEIIDAIGNFDYAVEEHGCQFYKDNIEAIASEQDKERLQKTRHWEDVNRCISNIKQYSFENLPLISINKKNEN